MSVHPRAAYVYKPTLQPSTINLAAHTLSATAVTEAFFHGRISQDDYDARILATCIISITRGAHAPIIMTTDDTLTTIHALAVRGLNISSDPIDREKAKLYLLCPKRFIELIGIPTPVSGEFVPLDQDGLKKLLTFIKGGDGGVDKLAIACEDDLVAAEDCKNLLTRAADLEDDTRVMRDWRPTASSGDGRGREIRSDVGSSAQNPGQAHHRNVALRSTRSDVALRSTREFHRANEQHHTEREAPGASKKEGREPGWRA